MTKVLLGLFITSLIKYFIHKNPLIFTMKKIIIVKAMLLSIIYANAQTGINIVEPKASLHLEPSNISSPNGLDGILIPKVSNFPIAQLKGQMVFLQGNLSLPNGFYYWDGVDWKSQIINAFDRTVDKSIYVVTGVGYAAGAYTENAVFFDTIKANDPTGFSLSGNSITIGKTGKYLVSFNSAMKISSNTINMTLVYRIKRGSSILLSTATSTTSELTNATAVAVNGMLNLNAGDVINVTVQRNNENQGTPTNVTSGYGTNCITFTYLKS